MDYRKYFIQASETYLDLLEKSDLSIEEINEEYELFKEKILNEEFLEESKSCKEILINCELLHDEKINKDYFEKGIIVILEASKRKIILDGNHRINLMKEINPNFEFNVVIIDGKL